MPLEWFHCMKCLVQVEDFESGAAMPAFFLTSCGHVLCGGCADKKACSRCARSPVQMVPISGDMPDEVAFLFEDAAKAVKNIYKGLNFQGGHTKNFFDGMKKKNERLSQKEAELTSRVRCLTKELADVKEQLEALKLENERPRKKATHDERGRSSQLAVFDKRPRHPFEQRRRTEGASFPDGVPVHPLLSAKTPAELRKYQVNPVDLGRPMPASERPRGEPSPSYARQLVMDAGNEQRHRPGAAAATSQMGGARSVSPLLGNSRSPMPRRASDVAALRKLNKFPF